jgi:type VI secretion system secreted protein VgrG
MAWNTQPRTLEVTGDALPKYYDRPVFETVRLSGVEKLGRLYDYWIDVQTISEIHLSQVHEYVDVNKLVGQRMTVKIAIEGSGTAGDDGGANAGAGIRELTGVIAGVQSVGSDDRRAHYRLRLRPMLWLASLNRENRHFRDMNVREISDEILKKYPLTVRWRLVGAFNGNGPYPKRDYQRQYWESDWAYLNRLWQEWGITFYFDGDELVLMDNSGYPRHGAAYATLRYLDRNGQRIDEEHIHKLEYARALTTGKVAVIDYDYTRATARFGRSASNYRDATNDNAQEYTWADYAQPLQGAMGLNAQPNNDEFEADHLATVRADAHRNRSLRIRGEGNLRGVTTGRQFMLEGYPVAPVNQKYLVTGTKIEIVNNDTVTQGGSGREYMCRTKFTAQPSQHVFRTPLKAVRPRAFAEKAIVTGHDKVGVTTDAMARVRVWFVWDRVNKRDENASCWVPLSQAWQGQRYGAMWIPRVDDHVYIGYLNSDPDRPFILGSHVTDRNVAPWDLYANHALSGWRSQDLGGYGKGSNTVVTDDTPGQLQVQVTSDYANSRVVAGYNTRIDGDKGRTVARGEGIEIATEAHAVMRANRGMLVTTEARNGATAPMKDMGETVQRLTQAREQHETLADLAQQNRAQDHGSDQSAVAKAIKAQNDGIKGSAKTSGDRFPELSRPHLVLSSPVGIEATTAESTHIASGEHIALTSGQHFSLAAGGRFLASVLNGVRMFSLKAGMKLVAASGDIDLQALKDSINILAKLNISHTANRITITAKEELLLNGGGSYTRWNGGGVETGTNGSWIVHSGSKSITGPKSLPVEMPTLPGDVCIECLLKRAMNRSAFVNKGI